MIASSVALSVLLPRNDTRYTMNIRRLKGTQDILPQDMDLWQAVENKARALFGVYGYKEIRTPIIEEASLFARSVGSESDIVKKQIYSFQDQGKRNICLRPEETASVCRAYIENQIDRTSGFVKFFYMGPMFRSERPQAGRFRQFNQIGVEAIGSYSVYLDAEIIILLYNMLQNIGVSDFKIKLNSLGCDKDKSKARQLLKKSLKGRFSELCQDCCRRYDINILRILDCKEPSCRKIAASACLNDTLCIECADRFSQLKQILENEGIEYNIDQMLVRGLDYYTGIVFEVTAGSAAAQDAIAAGGRYDNLISDLGGENAGATGFAIGMERVIESLKGKNAALYDQDSTMCFIVTMGEAAYKKGFAILSGLRKAGIICDIDYQQKSFKAQMRYANKLNARYAIILGDDELEKGRCIIRDMNDSSQREIELDKVVDEAGKLVLSSKF
jgi:histidyl-tRNA synthetase